MEISEESLYEKTTEKWNHIQNLPIVQALIEILERYTCPSSCNAFCCRQYDIPVSEADIETISRKGYKARKIMQNLVTVPQHSDKKMPSKPCSFLKSGRCEIHRFKPLSCKLFPFILNDPNNPQYPHIKDIINVETCPLGCQFLVDYNLWTLFEAEQGHLEKDSVYENIKHIESVIKPFYSKNKPEKFQIIGFTDPNILKAFLFYLEIFPSGKMLQARRHVENIVLKK